MRPKKNLEMMVKPLTFLEVSPSVFFFCGFFVGELLRSTATLGQMQMQMQMAVQSFLDSGGWHIFDTPPEN